MHAQAGPSLARNLDVLRGALGEELRRALLLVVTQRHLLREHNRQRLASVPVAPINGPSLSTTKS